MNAPKVTIEDDCRVKFQWDEADSECTIYKYQIYVMNSARRQVPLQECAKSGSSLKCIVDGSVFSNYPLSLVPGS